MTIRNDLLFNAVKTYCARNDFDVAVTTVRFLVEICGLNKKDAKDMIMNALNKYNNDITDQS